jgi:hypothetical protein
VPSPARLGDKERIKNFLFELLRDAGPLSRIRISTLSPRFIVLAEGRTMLARTFARVLQHIFHNVRSVAMLNDLLEIVFQHACQ